MIKIFKLPLNEEAGTVQVVVRSTECSRWASTENTLDQTCTVIQCRTLAIIQVKKHDFSEIRKLEKSVTNKSHKQEGMILSQKTHA